MVAKYVAGSKVRIKRRDSVRMIRDPEIQRYENMVGEILDSISVVAFLSDPWAQTAISDKRIFIYQYTVRISDEIVLHDVSEDYLEIFK